MCPHRQYRHRGASLQQLVERGGRAAQQRLHAAPRGDRHDLRASISTRDAVTAPARKKRRRTRPTRRPRRPRRTRRPTPADPTRRRAPTPRPRRRCAVVTWSRTSVLPDGRTRTSAGLEQTPRTIGEIRSDMTSLRCDCEQRRGKRRRKWVQRTGRRRQLRRAADAACVSRSAARRSATSANDESCLPHPLEQLAGPRDLAGALVEVGERVPEAQVVRLDALHVVGASRERRDRVLQAAVVGERAGEHDAALGDERRPTATTARAPPTASSTRS